jgi:integrase
VDPRIAAAEDVCAYLALMADEGLSAATIDLAYIAIGVALRHARAPGWESGRPLLVRQARKAIRRKIGVAPRNAKAAMTLDELRALLTAIDARHDPQAIRDRAMVTLHFWSALRRAELCALQAGDVAFVEEGLLVTLGRSKTDQTGVGRLIGLPYTDDAHVCPVRSLRAWMDRLTIPGGLLFAIQPQSYVKNLKGYLADAGLDASRFAGHSLRAGFVTAADAAGKSVGDIMRQTGHKSEAMVRRYIRHNDVFKKNAAKGLA